MTEVVRLLRKEHTDMAILLDLMERQIALFKQGAAPDFNIVRGVLDYFLTYPDLYHHPKEDLIFHKLRARDPEQAAAVDSLIAGHQDLAHLTRRFASATVDQMLHPDEVPRQWFASLARSFIDTNRRHMATEEEHFFPLVLRVLTEADWADLDTAVIDRDDPLFGAKVEERFQALRDAILEIERSGQRWRQA
ncbi:MAG: hemerythrin domain-containing protein [Kiloniellaceae bacterium]